MNCPCKCHQMPEVINSACGRCANTGFLLLDSFGKLKPLEERLKIKPIPVKQMYPRLTT